MRKNKEPLLSTEDIAAIRARYPSHIRAVAVPAPEKIKRQESAKELKVVICFKCGAPKKRRSLVDGKKSGWLCLPCKSADVFRYRRNNPKLWTLGRLRTNAKRRGIPFNLKEEDIPDFPEFCPVLSWIKWIKLIYAPGEGWAPGSVSIDRIDNNKGYERDNIRVISDRANDLKSDASDRELIALGKDAEKRIGTQCPT